MAFVPQFVLILYFIILVDFVTALTIEQVQSKKLKLFYLIVSLVCNVGLLAFFKYFNFLNENIASLLHVFGSRYQAEPLDLILPIGLSFHTFQSMSYTIEVYRGNQKAERHLGYFANYVLFFPQMVAGPIEKFKTLGTELKKQIEPSYENFSNGFRLVLFGLFVKMTIADNLAPIVNQVYEDPKAYSSLSVFTAVVFFSFQIYADFYGYSTIALGTARMLGINLMDNFKTPYLSVSINDFWNRWHISLTSWFREYVYFSLGGNKVSTLKWLFNILFIFFISGLWHGASWTFVVWGLLHGLFYLIERGISKVLKFKLKEGFSILNLFLGFKTFLLVSFIWIFFRAENFGKAKEIIWSLKTNWNIGTKQIEYDYTIFFIALLIIFDVFLFKQRFDSWMEKRNVAIRWSVYSILIFFILAMSGMENLPFIYFQF